MRTSSPKQDSTPVSQGLLTCRDTSSLFNISGDSGPGQDSHRLRSARSSLLTKP